MIFKEGETYPMRQPGATGRVITTDSGIENWPIIIVVTYPNGAKLAAVRTSNGKSRTDSTESPWDLMPPVTEQVLAIWWNGHTWDCELEEIRRKPSDGQQVKLTLRSDGTAKLGEVVK